MTEAAQKMKERDIGDVIVLDDDRLCGVVTDRDMVVRALAEERDPGATKLGDICSREVVTVAPRDDLTTAGDLMRQKAIPTPPSGSSALLPPIPSDRSLPGEWPTQSHPVLTRGHSHHARIPVRRV